MKVDLSADRHGIFAQQHLRRVGGTALSETAARLVMSLNPGQEARILRRKQRLVNTIPAVRRLYESLPANHPERVGLDLRPRRRQSRLLAASPDQIFNAVKSGVPVAESAPRRRNTGGRLLAMSSDEIWRHTHRTH